MKKVIHPSGNRGFADHGWLKARHSFSFASWYDPEKVHFGTLRVLNDDIVSPGMGFGLHPHDNMEIITIPLKGALQHKDTMGSNGIIRTNDVQVMSAGSGLMHSEVNSSKDEDVNLLQIWIFPNKKNVEPRYDQKTFDPKDRMNKLQLIVSPDQNNSEALWIHQDAWFSLGKFAGGSEITYSPKLKANGIYLFVIEDALTVADEKLNRRDAIGISDFNDLRIRISEDAEFLIMDIPMN